MKKAAPKQEEARLKQEVTPKTLGILLGVIVLIVGGYVFLQFRSKPHFVLGTGSSSGGAPTTPALEEAMKRRHKDDLTGQTITKD